jgi:hypothetical protein
MDGVGVGGDRVIAAIGMMTPWEQTQQTVKKKDEKGRAYLLRTTMKALCTTYSTVGMCR